MREHLNGKIDDFSVAGRACSVRAVQNPNDFSWKVQGYVESTPIGAEYGVSAENVSDAKMQDPDADIVAGLMTEARAAIESGTIALPPKAL